MNPVSTVPTNTRGRARRWLAAALGAALTLGVATVATPAYAAPTVPTYLNAYRIPGSDNGATVGVRAKLWNATDYSVLAGQSLTLTLDGTTQTVVTDAQGEATLTMPTGATRKLTATYAGDGTYLSSTDTTTIPTGQLPPGDIVFTVDESGSMATVQTRIQQNIVRIANQLATQLDYQIAIMGFGGYFPNIVSPNYMPRIVVPATDNLADVTDAANQLAINGGTEPGIDAIVAALDPKVGLRAGAGRCVVLVGDEPTQKHTATVADAEKALADNGAILFSIVSANTYIDNTDYRNLAINSGGKVFDIAQFATDPEPVLQELLSSCATALVQRPDLSVTIDDSRTESAPGDEVTYTVTVNNVGPIKATGTELTVGLPANLSVVDPSGATVSGSTLTWPLFDLAGGVNTTRTFKVKVDPAAAAGDTITVTAKAFDDGTNGNDLTPANNESADTDTVVKQTVTPSTTPTPSVTAAPTTKPSVTHTPSATAAPTTKPSVTRTPSVAPVPPVKPSVTRTPSASPAPTTKADELAATGAGDYTLPLVLVGLGLLAGGVALVRFSATRRSTR